MDKYLQYNHIELSEDSSFIRWAKSSESRDDNDWEAWLTNHPEKMIDVEKAKSIVLAMKFVTSEPSTATQEAVWSKIKTHINTAQSPVLETKTKRPQIIKMLWYGAAAAIVMVLLFQNIGNGFDTTVRVPFAKIENVTLPDGSEVTINADSELNYDVESWSQNRIVKLKGEAFFSVEKGSKFTVKTARGSVQVLGTSFNVYDRDNQFNVHCETGKVSVKSFGKETILSPGQAVSILNKKHLFEENIPVGERRSSWKIGIFVYKGAFLNEVIAELERQFDIKISIDNTLAAMKYTGSFDKGNISTALTEVCYPLRLKFDVEGKNVKIYK